jgi:O-acetylhomoserine/O-acetylserine sulfhydrylase-like pyridoxal-dependent enzyme
MIDNTWAAGVLFKALDFGIDISIQAGTKYLIGHSDAMVGTAVSNARCWDQLRENAYLMGQMVDADTAYMTSRGLRTWACACVSTMKAACDRRMAGAASAGGAREPSRAARQQRP